MAKIIDRTKPRQVTGLKVKGTATEKLTNLSWAAGIDNVGVVQYEIRISGSKKVYKSKKTNLAIKKLSAGLHTFTVVAIDKAKNRSVISVGYKFTVKDITAPKTGKVSLKQQSQNNVVISLSKFTDNVKVARYDIYLNGTKVGSTSSSQYTYKGKNLSGSLKFSVKAVDAAGNVSKEKKATVKIKDVTDPTQVKNLNVSQNDKNIILKWDAAKDNVGVTKYDIYVDGKKYSSKTNSLSISRKKLKAGTHNFKVVAWDKAKNDSAFSAVKSFTISSGSSSSGSSSSGGGINQVISGVPYKVKNVFGTSGTSKNDTITFQKDRDFRVLSDISLGKGNDKIVIPDFTYARTWDDDNYEFDFPEDVYWPEIAFDKNVEIDMGEGNDTLDIGEGVYLGYCERIMDTYDYDEISPFPYKINMGEGNDTIKMRYRSDLDTLLIDMGAGDDILDTGEVNDLCIGKAVTFGSGNDTLIVGKNTWLTDGCGTEVADLILDFGIGDDKLVMFDEAFIGNGSGPNTIILFDNGNDKMIIGKNVVSAIDNCLFGQSENSVVELDFGAGTDTLDLNGTLQVFADRVFFTGLEKICGSGCLELKDGCEISPATEWQFKKAGITVKYVNEYDR